MADIYKRNFVFTINNYTTDDIDILQSEKFQKQLRYMIYGYEEGKQHTPHIQGYVIFKSAKKFSQIAKLLPRAHIEIAKGGINSNVKYCSKDGKVVEYGKPPQKSGKRTDIDYIKQCVKDNTPVQEVIANITSYNQLKLFESLQKYKSVEPIRDVSVYWYYGQTGSGKTYTAIHKSKMIDPSDNPYITGRDLKWWDGYYGQKCVIIDDFRGDFCTYHELLRILDKYAYRLQIKGSSVNLEATHIFITSCFHPSKVYRTLEDIGQLMRRITGIYEFVKSGKEYKRIKK